ncbi:uncharacterized protein L3040_008809 [Drepanopeziza brunnea f. sp. 'multigermtubi']|uniref:uncharacterized protein n=1 Tax=Drepanopeziza brunnea f. sp. 'multigermtubi' TaxID=698441 RepID=UPI00239C9362|nr:hypothetical protein L3040_008809 [Drepanopeziza brunnea f. sp. 'multigermtubi']
MMNPMTSNRPSQLQPAYPRYLSALAQFPEPHQIARYLVVMKVANRGLDLEQELTCSVGYRSEGSLIQRLPMQSKGDYVDSTAPIQRLPMQSKEDDVDGTAPIQRLPMQSNEDDVDGTAPIQRLPFVVNYQLNVTITTGSSIASMRQCSLLPSVYLEIYQATMGGPGADGELQSTSEDSGPKAKPPSY